MPDLIALAPGMRLCQECRQVVSFAAYLDGTWRCPLFACGFQDLCVAPPQALPILLGNLVVGQRTPAGSYLDRATFRQLRRVDQVRAYLALVAPHARTPCQIQTLTGIVPKDLPAFLAADVRKGRVVKEPVPRDRYRYHGASVQYRSVAYH